MYIRITRQRRKLYFSEYYFENQNNSLIFVAKDMRIFTEQTLKEYIGNHPDARVALQEWVSIVKRSEWTCFADVRQSFGTVDAVGNQHFVFDIKGNRYRLVVVIKFTIRFVYIRFIGTHEEYMKIDCANI